DHRRGLPRRAAHRRGGAEGGRRSAADRVPGAADRHGRRPAPGPRHRRDRHYRDLDRRPRLRRARDGRPLRVQPAQRHRRGQRRLPFRHPDLAGAPHRLRHDLGGLRRARGEGAPLRRARRLSRRPADRLERDLAPGADRAPRPRRLPRHRPDAQPHGRTVPHGPRADLRRRGRTAPRHRGHRAGVRAVRRPLPARGHVRQAAPLRGLTAVIPMSTTTPRRAHASSPARRAVLAGALALPGAAALASCASGVGTTSTADGLTLLNYEDIDAATLLREQLDAFAGDSGIRTTLDTVPGSGAAQFPDKLRTRILGGNAPDVWQIWGGQIGQPFVEAGLTLDLAPYYDEYGWEETLSPAGVDGMTFLGKRHGAPINVASLGAWCNARIFEEAGAAVPTTYDELEAANEAILASGVTPGGFGGKYGWHIM